MQRFHVLAAAMPKDKFYFISVKVITYYIDVMCGGSLMNFRRHWVSVRKREQPAQPVILLRKGVSQLQITS